MTERKKEKSTAPLLQSMKLTSLFLSEPLFKENQITLTSNTSLVDDYLEQENEYVGSVEPWSDSFSVNIIQQGLLLEKTDEQSNPYALYSSYPLNNTVNSCKYMEQKQFIKETPKTQVTDSISVSKSSKLQNKPLGFLSLSIPKAIIQAPKSPLSNKRSSSIHSISNHESSDRLSDQRVSSRSSLQTNDWRKQKLEASLTVKELKKALPPILKLTKPNLHSKMSIEEKRDLLDCFYSIVKEKQAAQSGISIQVSFYNYFSNQYFQLISVIIITIY
jgi:hypothetical protein